MIRAATDANATGCRVAVIDVRGRGDCAIGYPPRGRFYFPGRITDEAYLTWFTLMLGKPLLGGQIHDTLRALCFPSTWARSLDPNKETS